MPISSAKWGLGLRLSAISSAINLATLPDAASRRVGFPAVALSDDQKAMLRLLAQREQGYEDIARADGPRASTRSAPR